MRVAVLGLGFMGSTHLKALLAIPGAEVVAVFSGDERKLSGDFTGIQGNLGGPGERLDLSHATKYREIGQVLRDARVEAVDICLPTPLHESVSIDALRAGKHVLVEKPMALDRASAERMIAEAGRQKRVLMVAQVLRFFGAYRALAEILASGQLGAPRSALFRRRCGPPGWSGWLNDPEQSGGAVLDLLIHDIDMCLHLFGKPQSISATGPEAPAAGIDLMTAELHYAGGWTAIVTGGWHASKSYPFSMEYTVVAERGTVEYSSTGREPAVYPANGPMEPLRVSGKDGYRAEIEYFLECCSEGTEPDLCPPHQSRDAVSLARQLMEARRRNGEKIACDL